MKSLITVAKEDCDCISISNHYIGQILSKIEPLAQSEFLGFIAFTTVFRSSNVDLVILKIVTRTVNAKR